MKTIQTVKDKLAVKLFEPESITDGGLILPSGVNKDPQGYGVVTSIGEEVENIKVGDTIMFHRSAGMDMILDRVIYKVLLMNEVYGILGEVDEN